MQVMEQVPEQVTATPEMVRAAVLDGGHATVTVKSPSGRHVTIQLVCRAKKASGQGWVSRATQAGRVGFGDAACIEARDPDLEYPENYIGRFYKDTGEWKAGRSADGARVWTAERVIGLALGSATFESAEVFLATQCCVCARPLRHPESIAELIGPECSGRRREGRAAARQTQLPA